ncbi:SGNH/GDSL hydrolase family protein [Enterobacter quasiroggenkampii]|nr:SGNH/GDSL hydrolase family protein [Enterobacter quasiroggenkampii]
MKKELYMSDDVMTKTDMVVASYDSSYFTYESVDSALKETNENEYFRVPQGVEASSAFIYYRKVSGKAVEVAEIIGGQYVKDEIQAIYENCGRSPKVFNLFDASRITEGKYVNTVGSLSANAAYFASDMMPVQSGTQYVFARSVAHLAFYGFDKKFISYAGAVGAATPFSTPDDAFFVRFSQTLSTGADTQMLTKGTSKPSVYMGYGWRDWYSQDLKSHQQTVELFNRNFPGANLVNRDQVLMGYALSTNGSVTSNASYFVTDFIPVAPLATYICNKASNVVCCYDVNLKKVDVLSIHTNTPFTTPASAAYIRMHATPLNTADVLMVLHGNEMPSDYVPFGAPNKQDIMQTSMQISRSTLNAALPSGRNIFDKSRARVGYTVSYQNGAVGQNAAYAITGLIPVTPGGHFVSSSGSNSLCFYNASGQFIAGSKDYSSAARMPIPVPEGAWFVQFQITPVNRMESLMVTEGDAGQTGYIPFGGNGSILPGQGKKVLWLGDSITHSGFYIPFVLKETGLTTLANYGVPGQGVRTMADRLTTETITDADLISVFGGTNDYGGNRPLGTLGDSRGDYDESKGKSFYYDVFYVLNTIFTLKPDARVVVSTPLKRGNVAGQAVVYPAANGIGVRLEEYVQAIKDVCSLFSVPVCDLFNESGVNLYNLSVFTLDNLHPNDVGAERISHNLVQQFNTVL